MRKLLLGWLTIAALLQANCTSTQKSNVNEAASRSCGPGANDSPVLAVLSSQVLGGTGGGPLRIAYVGGIPAVAVLYSGNQLIYAKNISKTQAPFYSYFCVKLSDEEIASLTDGLSDSMPDLFDAFDPKESAKDSGYTEVISFKDEFDCSQYEMRGSPESAKAFGARSRSSVALKVPSGILDFIERISKYENQQGTPYFPDQVLVELRELSEAEAKASKATQSMPWPSNLKLTKVNDKAMKLQTDAKSKVYTTVVDTAKLKDFSQLMRAKILKDTKLHTASYRFMLPMDRYWAAPYPTKGEEYSICNRYAPHTNFWRLYGLNNLASGN